MERQKRSWLTRREKVELFEQIRREIVWRRNDCRSVAEVGSAPADGAGGAAQCGAGREQATAKAAKEVGGWARVNCNKWAKITCQTQSQPNLEVSLHAGTIAMPFARSGGSSRGCERSHRTT